MQYTVTLRVQMQDKRVTHVVVRKSRLGFDITQRLLQHLHFTNQTFPLLSYLPFLPLDSKSPNVLKQHRSTMYDTRMFMRRKERDGLPWHSLCSICRRHRRVFEWKLSRHLRATLLGTTSSDSGRDTLWSLQQQHEFNLFATHLHSLSGRCISPMTYLLGMRRSSWRSHLE